MQQDIAGVVRRGLPALLDELFFNEQQFVDDIEMAEIRSNKDLLKRISNGSRDARQRKGAFFE